MFWPPGLDGRPGIVRMSPQIGVMKPAPADRRISRIGIGVDREHAAHLANDVFLFGSEAVGTRHHTRRAHGFEPMALRDPRRKLRDVVVDAELLDRPHLAFDERRQAHRVEVVAEEDADTIGESRQLLLGDLTVHGGEEQAEADLRFDTALGHERAMLAQNRKIEASSSRQLDGASGA